MKRRRPIATPWHPELFDCADDADGRGWRNPRHPRNPRLFDDSDGRHPVDHSVIVSAFVQHGLSIASFEMQFIRSELRNQIA